MLKYQNLEKILFACHQVEIIKKMVKPTILDIDSGNILSLKNIINKFHNNVKISKLDEDLENCTHIFLPGVGSYAEVTKKLKKNINIELLKKKNFR